MSDTHNFQFTSKLPHVGTTIFTTMSALSNTYNAINLSQGFPDFPIDPELGLLIAKNTASNLHQYAPMMGLPKLREEIKKMMNKQHQRKISIENILITAGATQAIFTAIQAFVHEGDEVIIVDPAYDCYAPAVELCRGRCVHIPLTEDFNLDLEAIQNQISQKTKMLIINNPHNPTGTVFDDQTLKNLTEILDKHPQCLILSDEVYEFIKYTDDKLSMHQFSSVHNRLITVSSFGKTLHITGWKIGYLTAPDALIKEITKVHQFLVFSVNHFAQEVLAQYLSDYNLNEISSMYQKKRDLLSSVLTSAKFKLLPCKGTYFQLLDYSEISPLNDIEFTTWMTQEVGVASIPTSVFYNKPTQKKLIRLCFAKNDEILTKAANLLCQI